MFIACIGYNLAPDSREIVNSCGSGHFRHTERAIAAAALLGSSSDDIGDMLELEADGIPVAWPPTLPRADALLVIRASSWGA